MTEAVGRLRPDVEVVVGPDGVVLRYGFWETMLPTVWVDSTPGFREFLELRAGIDDLGVGPGLAGVRELLAAQGCLISEFPGPSVSLRCVRDALVLRFTAAYGRYYRHPAWQRILDADHHALASWLVHNFQLSRSVGQTAARGALRSSDARARATFRRNALEEYDHFERFFSPHHTSLGIDRLAVARAVPSPATLAFGLQMLHLAEHDWLAHTLVAWFQERTERFAEEAEKFYTAVEQKTHLTGFFRRWLEHVEYDRSSRHADAFANLLNREETIERTSLEHSIRRASFAVSHLIKALDEIATPPPAGRMALLRLPPTDGRLDPGMSRLLDAWPSMVSPISFNATDLGELWQRFAASGFLPTDPIEPASSDIVWLTAAIAHAALLWLSRAERGPDLLACGALVEALDSRANNFDEPPRTPACQAIGAFLAEAAGNPQTFALSVRPLLAVAPIEQARDLASVVDRQLAVSPVANLDEAITLLLQMSEFVVAWKCESRQPPTDALSW